MKQFFLSLLLLGFVGTLSAQQRLSADQQQEIQSLTDELADRYELDVRQTTKMYQIQERKLRSLAEIEAKHAGDADLYLRKLQALETGTDGSISIMLNERQRKVFQKDQSERRLRRAVRAKELTNAGMTPDEIQLELLKVE